ncbi:MAG: amylo-alpha-1,6-glucosidase, partial [Deltaproteobacteria bacterium]|nr:amylo-alpha-1,6-glucosidase [Deltaproteobacteria bacterium]
MVTGLDGFVHHDSEQGLFVHETRLLSQYRYLLNDEAFYPVALSNVEQHSWVGYYIQVPPEMKHGRSGGSGEVPKKSQHTVELIVHRQVGEGLHEQLFVTNFNQTCTSFRLRLNTGADFADIDELPDKREQRGELHRTWRRADTGDWELVFDYQARHRYSVQGNSGEARLHRGLIIRIEESDSTPYSVDSEICFDIKLEPQATWRASIDFIPLLEGSASAGEGCLRPLSGHRDEFEAKRQKFFASTSTTETPSHGTMGPVVIAALERAREDLAALRFYDLDTPGGWTFAAGVPSYTALFGRDTLIAAWQAAMLSPQLLRGTLSELARWQADSVNLWRDQLPNGMLHEAHTGPLSVLNYSPRAKYYGTLTTPVFYPTALAEFWRWMGTSAVSRPLLDTAMRGLKWMEKYARSSRHGFFQYQTSSEQG